MGPVTGEGRQSVAVVSDPGRVRELLHRRALRSPGRIGLSPEILFARAAQISLATLALFLFITTVRGAIDVFSKSSPSVRLAEPPKSVPPSPRRSLSDYSVIFEKDIFNPPRPPQQRPSPRPSQLSAKLVGTAPGQEARESYAILEDAKNGKQDLYRLGDTIQDHAIIDIGWDQVTLSDGAGERVLKVAIASSDLPLLAEGHQQGKELSLQRFVLASIEAAQPSTALANENALLRLEPIFTQGKLDGIRVSAIQRESVFDKLGLEDGDVVRRINEKPLIDPIEAITLIQGLSTAGRVTVEVGRGGQSVHLAGERSSESDETAQKEETRRAVKPPIEIRG